uniref:Protein-L-isoaspartate O-methyltransferase domain-containing protein 1 n=1 Tax=Panagrellus redivivus TaxID=6233 RepID=A0A7E4VHF5_PANRE
MGQSQTTGRNNHDLVDQQVADDTIETTRVEFALRIVDRGLFFTDSDPKVRYKDAAWKAEGSKLHISAPSIYAMVLEHLQPQRGQKFLNLGSGTGYFSSVVGMFLGSNGVNHGVELHPETVEWARNRQAKLQETYVPSVFDWCAPEFFTGNVFQLKTDMRYDRIYIGAKVPEGMRLQFVKLLKVGGVAIMPYGSVLQRIQRSSEKTFLSFNISSVDFSGLCLPEPGSEYDRPVEIPMDSAMPTLSKLARNVIMKQLRVYSDSKKTITIRQRCSSDHVDRYPYDDAEDNMLNDHTNVGDDIQDENAERITTPERSADGYTIFALRRYTTRLRVRLDGFPENILRLHGNFIHFGEFEAFAQQAMGETSEDEEEGDADDEGEDEHEDAGIIADEDDEAHDQERHHHELFAHMFVDTVDRLVNYHRDGRREETPPVEAARYRRQLIQMATRPLNFVANVVTPHNTATSTSRQTPDEDDDIDTTSNPESSNDTIISNAATTSSTSAASSTESSNAPTPTNPPAPPTATNATNRKRRARSSSPSCAKYSRRPNETYSNAPEPFNRPGLRMATLVNGDVDSVSDTSNLAFDLQFYYNTMKKALEAMPLPRKVTRNLLGEDKMKPTSVEQQPVLSQ